MDGPARDRQLGSVQRVYDRRRQRQQQFANVPRPANPHAPVREVSATYTGAATEETPATEKQMASIRKLCTTLGKPEPATDLTFAQAKQVIIQLSTEYQRARKAS